MNGLRVHEVTGQERLDEIAYRYYGDPGLWRLIAVANDLADPLHLPPGSLLRIPSLLPGRPS